MEETPIHPQMSTHQWAVMGPYVPIGGTDPVKGGSPVTYPRRDIVDAIQYIARTGCQWRALPADSPPWEIVYHYFRAWNRGVDVSRPEAPRHSGGWVPPRPSCGPFDQALYPLRSVMPLSSHARWASAGGSATELQPAGVHGGDDAAVDE